MRRQPALFFDGRQGAHLSDLLNHHKQQLVDRINHIANLDELTDEFLATLVDRALVTPLTIHFDRIYRDQRTEILRAEDFTDRWSFRVDPNGEYPKTVYTIHVPFSGDKALLQYRPNRCNLSLPTGDVVNDEIKFDVLMMGYEDDAKRAKERITQNLESIKDHAGWANDQVRTFNLSLPTEFTEVFKSKLSRLSTQHAILDELGIPQRPRPLPMIEPRTPAVPAKRARREAALITQVFNQTFIEKVETVNQTNNNTGDVNNAFQSGE
jgi:hypothetical protein